MFGYNPKMPYDRDIDKAKQLLAEAGYPDGFDVELLCFDTPPWVNVSRKIQQDLTEAGIRVKLLALPSEEVHEKMFTRDFQLLHMMWSLDYVDPSAIVTPFVHADSLEEDATVQLMAWWLNYMNPETTALAEQAVQELDQETRKELYQKITDIILDDGPYAPLYALLTQYAVRSEVNEFLGTPPPYSGFPVIR